MDNSNNKSFFEKYSILLLISILIISAILKYIYVFYYTNYSNYLASDMGQYWKNAENSFFKGDFEPSQWLVWPPFAHIVLAWVFKILYLFDLFEHKLEITLGLNIVLSTLTIWFIYLIALKLFKSYGYALLVATLYALFFPLTYYNAFILSENPSLFAFMLAITLLLYNNGSKLQLFLIGLILAFAIAIRPTFGVAGLPFALYILFKDGFSKSKIIDASAFSFGYFIFLFLVVVNNYAISMGNVKGLSANGGLNYYFVACRKHTVETYTDDGYYIITAASTNNWPELGKSTFKVPFYEQSFYYKKGLECIKKKPFTFKERFKKFKLLFSDSYFPMMQDAKYAKDGFELFSKIALYTILLLLFLPILFFDKRVSKSTLWLLIGAALSQVIIIYFFNIEHRYLYGFFFIVLTISILILRTLITTFRDRYKTLIPYTIIVLIAYYSYLQATKITVKNIDMSIYQDRNKITKLEQKRDTKELKNYKINTINFIKKDILKHADLGTFNYKKNFFIDFNATMNVLKDGNYTIITVADDGFKLNIDKKDIISHIKEKEFDVSKITTQLTKGVHKLNISYFQANNNIAMRAYYEIDNKRYFIGEDSKYIKFTPNTLKGELK